MEHTEWIEPPAPDKTSTKKDFSKYRTPVEPKPYMFPYEDALLDVYFTLLSDIENMKVLSVIPREALADAEKELTALNKTMKEAGIIISE